MVRGYLIYQEVWEVCIGEILSRIREAGNRMRSLFLPLDFMEILLTSVIKDTQQNIETVLSRSESMRLLN